jgi:hypothetical protein
VWSTSSPISSAARVAAPATALVRERDQAHRPRVRSLAASPSTTRDATYVLDGILDNETELPLFEHTTDTAGYTDLVFALFDLLVWAYNSSLGCAISATSGSSVSTRASSTSISGRYSAAPSGENSFSVTGTISCGSPAR